jgi:hypothetical protein
MSARVWLVVAGAAAVVVAVLVVRAPAPAPATPPAAAPPSTPDDHAPRERPPEFPPVAGRAELISNLLRILVSGDEADVDWSVSRLVRLGDEARAAFRDAGTAAVATNPALVEQALAFLLASPQEADGDFARAALATNDEEAVRRAIRLLAAAPGADRDGAARAVASPGGAWGAKARFECVVALGKIGGDVAADEAVRVVSEAPTHERPSLYGAVGEFRHPRVHAHLAAEFAATKDDASRIAVAGALLAGGDPSPTSWLESLLDARPSGRIDRSDAALAALATARHRGALERIGAVVADAMESLNRRVVMLDRLRPYPLEDKEKYLRAAAAEVEGVGDEIRIEAYDALVRAGAPGALATLQEFAEKGDLRKVNLAALILGRVRTPEAARSLVAAVRRADVDDDTRTMCLRAVVLSGATEHAEIVVRAMAEDHVAYDARKSYAQNIGAKLVDATPEFRAAAGAVLLRAMSGEFGALSGAGLVQVLMSTAVCCGDEAAAATSAYLTHADLPVRLAAATTLGFVAGPDSERDLRAAWWRTADPTMRRTVAVAMERAHYRLPPSGR